MNDITIAIQTHNFQHRLSWMLSSLYYQRGRQSIVIDISSMRNNGTPSTEKLIDLYSNRLQINHRIYDDYERFKYRGYTRTDQLKSCKTEWILFADTDMVYHNRYFKNLLRYLNDSDKSSFFSAGRYSMTVLDGNTIIDKYSELVDNYNKRLNRSWGILNKSEIPFIRRNNVGAGYSQIINVHNCPHENYYVLDGQTKDYSWDVKGQKAKSDIQFRKRIKKMVQHVKLPKWFSCNQIHINHDRDSVVGYHSENQR